MMIQHVDGFLSILDLRQLAASAFSARANCLCQVSTGR